MRSESLLILETEAAEYIGGYYNHSDKSIQRRRIRKLMKKAGVRYAGPSRQRSIHRNDLPKLMEAIPWQSNLTKEVIHRTGGCAAPRKGSPGHPKSENLQAYFTKAE